MTSSRCGAINATSTIIGSHRRSSCKRQVRSGPIRVHQYVSLLGVDVMTVQSETTPADELDFGAVGRALWRKKWWVIVPTLLVAALTFAGVNLVTPKYKSEARILIEGRENVFLRPEADKQPDRDRAVDPETVTSQVQLV